MGTSRRWLLGLVAAVLVVAVGACSGSRDTSSSSAAPAGGVAQDAAASNTGQQGASPSDGLGAVQQPADRKQIRTGRMTLAVAGADDVGRVATEAVNAAEDAGGRVDADHRTGGDQPSVELTLRVPPEELDATVNHIRGLAEVPESSIDTEDVDDKYTDLEGRVQALEASTARLRGFLSEATDANQIGYLEGELTRREADLESLKGQLRALSAKTDMATLKVSVRVQTPIAPEPDTSSAPAPIEALRSGWQAFGITMTWIVAVVLAVLPFLVLAAVVAVGARWWLRHRARSAPTPADAG